MANTATLGTGTTLTFSGFSANVLSVGGPNPTRESVPTSHLGTTGGKTFIPGELYDPGEITVTIHWDDTGVPAITSGAATCTIDWGGTGATSVVSAFITNISPSAEGGDSESIMTADVTFKATGAIT